MPWSRSSSLCSTYCSCCDSSGPVILRRPHDAPPHKDLNHAVFRYCFPVIIQSWGDGGQESTGPNRLRRTISTTASGASDDLTRRLKGYPCRTIARSFCKVPLTTVCLRSCFAFPSAAPSVSCRMRSAYHLREPRRRSPLSGFSSAADSFKLASNSKSKAGPSFQRAPARKVSPLSVSATPVYGVRRPRMASRP